MVISRRSTVMRPAIWLLATLSAGLLAPTPHTQAAPDILIENVDVIDVEAKTVIRDSAIAIEGGNIAYIGPTPPSPGGATVRLDGSRLVALPGFVNTHTHLWQHVSKALKPGGTLQSWSPIVHQFLHYATEQEMYDVTLAAAGQTLLSGITTVSDFASPYASFTLDATSSAIKDAGLGGVIMYWNPAVFLPPDIKRQDILRLKKTIAPLDLWMAQGHAFLFEPPAIYDAIERARRMDLGVSEHVMETIAGNAAVHRIYSEYLKGYGDQLSGSDQAKMQQMIDKGAPSSVDRLRLLKRMARQILADPETRRQLTGDDEDRLKAFAARPNTMTAGDALDFLGAFDLDRPFLMIHGVWTNPDNIETMAAKGVIVTHQADSNQRLSSGIAPIWDYAKAGVSVTLGTDGAASNDGISVFSAMKAAWNLQNMEYLDSVQVSRFLDAWYFIRAVTLEGARALGLGDRTGSLKMGKEADIVLLSKDRLGLSPIIRADKIDNLIPLIIYSGDARIVDTVISDGRIVVRNAALQPPLDESKLAQSLTDIANAVMIRQAEGKTWTRVLDAGALETDGPWYTYSSVRKADTVDLRITNSSAETKRILLAFAGATEGGATAPQLTDETKARFPIDPPKGYWQKEITIEPGQYISVRKAPKSFAYTVTSPDGVQRRQGVDEQVLLLVR